MPFAPSTGSFFPGGCVRAVGFSPQPSQCWKPPGTGASGVRECDYHVVTPPGYPVEEYDLTLEAWRDGAEAFAEDQYVVAMASHALHHQLTGDTVATPTDTLEHPSGPWDEAGFMSSPGYEAFKGPWLLRVSAMGHREAALGLLARATTAMSAR